MNNLFFEETSLFDFFGMDESDNEKEEVKTEDIDLSTDADDSDEEELDTSDDNDSEDSDDAAELDDESEDSDESLETSEEPDKSKKTAKESSKNKSSKKTEKVSLPITCYGRNFKVEIPAGPISNEISIDELVKRLYEMGYKEVAHPSVNPIKSSKCNGLWFSSPSAGSKESSTVGFIKDKAETLTITDGMEQMEISLNDFPGEEANEISTLEVWQKFEANFPAYAAQTLSIDIKSMVAVPVFATKVTDNEKVELPCNVHVYGQSITLTEDDFILEEGDVSPKQIISKVIEGDTPTALLKKAEDSNYFVEFSGTMIPVNRKSLEVNSSAKVVDAVVKYSLPLNVYFVTLNQNIELTSEHFNGKEKVLEKDVISLLGNTYSLLKNRDRNIDTYYSKEQNILSVALTSGKKGAEMAPFSLLKRIEPSKLKEAVSSDSFLGIISKDGEDYRLEVTPVFAMWGKLEKLAFGSTYVSKVYMDYKLPKIPRGILKAIAEDFKNHINIERIARIGWDTVTESYFIQYPKKARESKVLIEYEFEPLPSDKYLVVTVHSHNTFAPVFSGTDDEDEAITGIYGVIGYLDRDEPVDSFRIGMEGSFSYIPAGIIFEYGGSCYDGENN